MFNNMHKLSSLSFHSKMKRTELVKSNTIPVQTAASLAFTTVHHVINRRHQYSNWKKIKEEKEKVIDAYMTVSRPYGGVGFVVVEDHFLAIKQCLLAVI